MLKRRILLSLSGVIISAICVGLFKFAALGVDPFTVLPSGLDQMLPLSYGTLYIITNAVMLVFSLLADRHYIGMATFFNLFLVGYITQYSLALFRMLFPAPSLLGRFAALVIALVVLCFGSALYITADLGVSAYDAIALILANTWKLGKFKYLRIGTDVLCVIAGTLLFLLGGGSLQEVTTIAGIATIITAFFMGPLVDLFQNKIAIPLLHKGNAKRA